MESLFPDGGAGPFHSITPLVAAAVAFVSCSLPVIMSPCRPCRSNGKGQDLPVFFVPEPLARPDACSRADPSFPVSPVVLLRCFGDGRSIGVCGRNVIPSSKKNRRLW